MRKVRVSLSTLCHTLPSFDVRCLRRFVPSAASGRVALPGAPSTRLLLAAFLRLFCVPDVPAIGATRGLPALTPKTLPLYVLALRASASQRAVVRVCEF